MSQIDQTIKFSQKSGCKKAMRIPGRFRNTFAASSTTTSTSLLASPPAHDAKEMVSGPKESGGFPLHSPPTENINICFVGGVSTGKSTILNAFFCEELTQCKIKRTTMVPTVYVENAHDSTRITPSEEIFNVIAKKNASIIEKTENGEKLSKDEYSELIFQVGKSEMNITPAGVHVNVYDIPGLNDARTKDIYYTYLEESFVHFNIVIFIIDIHSGLNTSDEIDIVNFITTNTKYHLDNHDKKIYTLVLVNKADDMQLHEETNELMLTGELKEMFDQVEKTIFGEFEKKGIRDQLIGILPLSAIDAYLYRMVEKHGNQFKLTPEQILKIGINENGKKFSTLKPASQEKKVYEILQDQQVIQTMIQLSGFLTVESTLRNFLCEFENGNERGKAIQVDNLLFSTSTIPTIQSIMQSTPFMDFPAIFDHVLEFELDVFQKIKEIDYPAFVELMTEYVATIMQVLESKTVNYDSELTLLNEYDEFVKTVFVGHHPAFHSFANVATYPSFITTRVVKTIRDAFEGQTSWTVDGIVAKFCLLKQVNEFNKETIEMLMDVLIHRGNFWGFVLTNEPASDSNHFSPSMCIVRLIDLMKEFTDMGIYVMKFLRFLIVFLIKSDHESMDTQVLYTKRVFYQKYNETHVQNYLIQLLQKKELPEMMFVNDCEDVKHPLFVLDLFYLTMFMNA